MTFEPETTSRGGLIGKFRRGRREPFASAMIPATPADVWAIVSDVTRLSEWWPRVIDAHVVEGEDAGREQQVRLNWGRTEGVVRQRVVVWEPGRRYAWRVLSEVAGGRELPPLSDTTVTIRIEPSGAAANVRIEARFDPVGARGMLALRQLSRLARMSYKRALKQLAAVAAQG